MRFVHCFLAMIALTVMFSALTTPVTAQCFDSQLICVSENDRTIRVLDADSLTLISSFEVPANIIGPQVSVTGLYGVAYNPNTGELFVLMRTNQPSPLDIPYLASVDLVTQLSFLAGPTGGPQFRTLTFNGTNQLLALSSDSGGLPNAYCELNQATGAPTDLCSLPNGNDSQGLAYDPVADVVIHAANSVTEQVTALTGAGNNCGVSNVALNPALVGAGHRSISYVSEFDALYWAANDAANTIYMVQGTGTPTAVGNLTFLCSGMTEVPNVIPCPTDEFIRGDVDSNGAFVGLVDGLFLLNYQFAGGDTPPCLKAADADGNGAVVGLVDALYILNFQFAGGPAPLAPYPLCGGDMSTVTCLDPGPCP